jgi:hypothetical protein
MTDTAVVTPEETSENAAFASMSALMVSRVSLSLPAMREANALAATLLRACVKHHAGMSLSLGMGHTLEDSVLADLHAIAAEWAGNAYAHHAVAASISDDEPWYMRPISGMRDEAERGAACAIGYARLVHGMGAF